MYKKFLRLQIERCVNEHHQHHHHRRLVEFRHRHRQQLTKYQQLSLSKEQKFLNF
jgi:hypothetical protein